MASTRSPKACAEAQRLLEECSVTRPEEIDLERIAAANRAEIVYEDIDGATASVMRLGNVARIRISTRIEDVGWRRFTIAHESVICGSGTLFPMVTLTMPWSARASRWTRHAPSRSARRVCSHPKC